MTEPALSVIMPVYRVEPYVAAAVRSVLDSTLSDLELIIVDDGSPDASFDVALAAANNDPRVVVVRQENRGLGGARNTGLAVARGRYVTCVDSDDIVEHEHFEKAVTSLDETGSDFNVSRHRRLNPDGSISERPSVERVFATEYIGITAEDYPVILSAQSAWTKVYRRSFAELMGLRYTEGVYCEDQVAAVSSYLFARRFDVLTHSAVQYRIRPESNSIMDRALTLKFLRDSIGEARKAARLAREVGGGVQAEEVIRRDLAKLRFPPIGQLDDEVDYLTEVCAFVREFWARLSPVRRAGAFGLGRRAALYVAAHGTPADLRAFLAAGGLDTASWVLRPASTGLIATLPDNADYGIPAWVRATTLDSVAVRARIDAVEDGSDTGGILVRGTVEVPGIGCDDVRLDVQLTGIKSGKVLASVPVHTAVGTPVGRVDFEATINDALFSYVGTHFAKSGTFAFEARLTVGNRTIPVPLRAGVTTTSSWFAVRSGFQVQVQAHRFASKIEVRR